MRIAMWSGPRNLSTAMMYSFAQRSDCKVVDEPFYAAYLTQTGLEHPMRQEILASQPTEPSDVIAQLGQTVVGVRYEKHMAHHMLAGWDLNWVEDVTNVFLIRHPARVIASYDAKREDPTADDLGFRQQYDLFQRVQALGKTPIVVDSFDVRLNPEMVLTRLCDEIGINFEPAMLTWPSGGNMADGVWAKHWYGAVRRSTGFSPDSTELPHLDGDLGALMSDVLPYYEAMKRLSTSVVT